jgi:hypothetical protein
MTAPLAWMDYDDAGPGGPRTSSHNANRRSCGLGMTMPPFEEQVMNWAGVPSVDRVTARRRALRKLPAVPIACAALWTIQVASSSRIAHSSSSVRLVAFTARSSRGSSDDSQRCVWLFVSRRASFVTVPSSPWKVWRCYSWHRLANGDRPPQGSERRPAPNGPRCYEGRYFITRTQCHSALPPLP